MDLRIKLIELLTCYLINLAGSCFNLFLRNPLPFLHKHLQQIQTLTTYFTEETKISPRNGNSKFIYTRGKSSQFMLLKQFHVSKFLICFYSICKFELLNAI